MSIFDYYPKVQYNNITAVNILSEAEIMQSYLQNINLFYKYLIRDGERPDTVAYKEYGDSSLDWVILLANGIVDPYKDWPMEYSQFVRYLEDKYNTAAEKLASPSIDSSVKYYYYTGLTSDSQETINSYNYTLTPYTYQQLGSPGGWTAKTIWDYESEINESKREIKILRPAYISDFKQQLRDLFVNG
jgi:hypothetical protein